MNNPVSFISASFVARPLGYRMTEGWMQGDEATNAYFRPIETFRERFDALLGEVRALGFRAVDLWTAHLNPAWATDAHVQAARELLEKHDLQVPSLAGGVGSLEVLEGSCELAQAMGIPVLAGGASMLPKQRAEAVEILKHYGVKLAAENHPEKTPAELLAQIGDGAGGYLGAAADTGWWATQGYPAPQALRELGSHLMTVHLKDVKAPGGHETCRFGAGAADIKGCVGVLREIGYTGPLGIEHEPENFDPSEDVRASRVMLQTWLGDGETVDR